MASTPSPMSVVLLETLASSNGTVFHGVCCTELIRAYVRSFKTEIMKTSTYLYLDNDQKAIPWATSMVIQVGVSTGYAQKARSSP